MSMEDRINEKIREKSIDAKSNKSNGSSYMPRSKKNFIKLNKNHLIIKPLDKRPSLQEQGFKIKNDVPKLKLVSNDHFYQRSLYWKKVVESKKEDLA